MPSSRIRIVCVVVPVVLLACVLWWQGRERSASAPNDEVTASAPVMIPTATAPGESPSVGSAPITEPAAAVVSAPEPDAVAADGAHERELERIDAVVVTYSAEFLPALAVYLTHADVTVREAAREGFLQMGLTEGAEYLRVAADKIRDPREAVQLLDAADFLDLPTVPVTGGDKVLPVSPKTQERLARERAAAGARTEARK